MINKNGLIGRFAVVKLWPEIKAAEDENIARLKNAAHRLGLECIEITSDGRFLDEPDREITSSDVDFVIHLHFETPKTYDVFSFVALWNPLQFYFDWGYTRHSRNLLTHDDFLSCSSTWADDHVRRMIAHDPSRDGPLFTLYHSIAEPIIQPTLGECKIFYAGINWERLGKKKSRHQELLDLLDKTGDLRIYGPRIFQGVKVWEGYDSYIDEIPFDGVSMIKEIAKSGIGLALSSEAHKQSELMSNRLFECLAAGAVVICDENPFAERYFGDSLLYVDTTLPVHEVLEQIKTHMQWIKNHPKKAIALADKSQAIFLKKFSLEVSLRELYTSFNERKKYLETLYASPESGYAVSLYMLMPTYDKEILERHIRSAETQAHPGCHPVLLIDEHDDATVGNLIRERLDCATIKFGIKTTCFFTRRHRKPSVQRRMGDVLTDLLQSIPDYETFMIVAPNERLFSNHVQLLLGTLQRDQRTSGVYADILLKHSHDGKVFHDLFEDLDVTDYQPNKPLGYARFLFRRSAFSNNIFYALRYLDYRAIALLAGCAKLVPAYRATMVIDIQQEFLLGQSKIEKEEAIIKDFCPDFFKEAEIKRQITDRDVEIKQLIDAKEAAIRQQIDSTVENLEARIISMVSDLQPEHLSIKNLTPENRTALAAELAYSIPLPVWFTRFFIGTYKRWFRSGNKT